MREDVVLSPDQEIALKMIEDERVCFITGGGGCGKTTTIAYYMNELDMSITEVLLTATSNQAVKVLAESLTDYPDLREIKPRTVYAALGIKPTANIVTKKGDEVTKFNLPGEIVGGEGTILIVDEASMLPRELAKLLVDSDFKKIIFVGDECQLPPVKAKAYNFSRNLPTAELTVVHRTGKNTDLAEYYSQCREDVYNGNKLSRYDKPTRTFTNDQEMINYCKAYEGSFMILTYTNKEADRLSAMLGYGEIVENDYVRLLGSITINAKDKKKGTDIRLHNKDVVYVAKIFRDSYDMYKDAEKNNYAYWLPKDSIEFPEYSADNVTFIRAETDFGNKVYLALLFGTTAKEHQKAIAAKPNSLAREIFLQIIRDGGARDMHHLKKKLMKGKKKIMVEVGEYHGFKSIEYYSVKKWNPEADIFTMETIYIMRDHFPKLWTDNLNPMFKKAELEHYRFKEMIPSRSIHVSTVHSAQGMTLDMVMVDWEATSRKPELQYTAVSRARTDLCLLEAPDAE